MVNDFGVPNDVATGDIAWDLRFAICDQFLTPHSHYKI